MLNNHRAYWERLTGVTGVPGLGTAHDHAPELRRKVIGVAVSRQAFRPEAGTPAVVILGASGWK